MSKKHQVETVQQVIPKRIRLNWRDYDIDDLTDLVLVRPRMPGFYRAKPGTIYFHLKSDDEAVGSVRPGEDGYELLKGLWEQQQEAQARLSPAARKRQQATRSSGGQQSREATPTVMGEQKVQRRRRNGKEQEYVTQQEPQQKVIAVIGNAAARQRGAEPAYTRTVTTRPVTFTCEQCGQSVTQQRFPGPMPQYCGEACETEAKRAKTRLRVQRLRERRRVQASTKKDV